MYLTPSSDKPWYHRLIKQLSTYSVVGVSTFIFDLAFLWVLLFVFDITEPLAIGFAFLVAIHINYTILRIWTYKKSPENVPRTYIYFMLFALAFTFIIPTFVIAMADWLKIDLMVARVLIGGAIGLLSFAFNSFFNFKLL